MVRQAALQKQRNEEKREEKRKANDKLIRAVQGKPAIYNKAHPDHADRIKIQRDWESIAREMGLTVEQCQKQWTYLRDQYSKRKKSDGVMGRSGDGGGDTTQSNTWAHTETMRFLDPYIASRG